MIPTMQDLMELCELDAPFRHKDQEVDGETFRIFTYGYLDSDMWDLPFARECRGHAYHVDTETLVCLPMRKFFNLGERKGQPNYLPSAVEVAWDKLDGSLISSWWFQGECGLKSKGSFHSEQATAAEAWLSLEQWQTIMNQSMDGWTLNFEWIGPQNQIVVRYSEPRLVLLNRRHRVTGRVEHAPGGLGFEVPRDMTRIWNEPDRMSPVNYEGYVLQMFDGEIYKAKSDWYLERHRLLDLMGSYKRWVEIILDGRADDIMSFVTEREDLFQKYMRVNDVCSDYMRWATNFVEKFHRGHGHMDRKGYALAGQALEGDEKELFPLLMQRYTGQEVRYQEHGIKRMESLILPHLEQR